MRIKLKRLTGPSRAHLLLVLFLFFCVNSASCDYASETRKPKTDDDETSSSTAPKMGMDKTKISLKPVEDAETDSTFMKSTSQEQQNDDDQMKKRREEMSDFERLWADDEELQIEPENKIENFDKIGSRWSLEDKRPRPMRPKKDSTEDKDSSTLEDHEMSDTDRVVEAIKMRFNNPDVIQVVEAPNLVDQIPGGGVMPKKFKLVLKESSMTPVEPITNLLNKRKEPEYPVEEEEENGEDGGDSDEQQASIMFKQAIELLGVSASRDSTGYHVITSVGKTEKVEQAYVLLQQATLRGHKKAMEIVAWGQLLGPLPLDIEGARIKFQTLGKKGYPNSQMAMGFMHANALEVELNSALPILYYTFSSIAGSSWSQMALGYRYWGGIGVQVSCEKALEQYRRVAATVASEVSEVGTGPAIQRIRLLDEMEGNSGGATSTGTGATGNTLNSDILDYYTMLAERGDLQAQVGLGQLHFQGGRGISPDHHLALRYFRRAADAGSPVAMAFLGKMYLEGNDAVEADTMKALKWFQKAAEQGSPVGQSGLGLMYLTGKGLPKDPSKALQYFTMAAEQGWVDGQLHLGNMYMTGIGVRRDYQQAAKYYNLAAQSGHILAIYNLAQMHATGTGMMRSCTAAVELYKTVAERGRWGLLLAEAHNDYKEKRYSNALIKYLLLAELGYEAAQANAGYMLERGEVGWEIFEGWKKLMKPKVPHGAQGGQDDDKIETEDFGSQQQEEPAKPREQEQPEKEIDPKNDLTSPQSLLSRALQQWSRSASQGYSHARVRLGDYYYYGWGTQTDYSSAATQYRLASEQQRNPQAMFNLAYMHEQGLGLKQDLHLAKRFYDMAAETSTDAKVPVTLALIKLNFMSTLHALKFFDGESQSTPVSSSESVSDSRGPGGDADFDVLPPWLDFANNWDLYLLTVLVGILGILVWMRRPPPQPQRR